MPKPHRPTRLFESDLLESLSRVHPATPALVWTPIAIWLFWRSFATHHLDGYEIVGLGGGGLLAWSFFEYAMHRFLFHLAPVTPWRSRLQFIVHGVHHEDPSNPTRLLMPPAPAIILAAVLYGVFRTILGPVWVEPFFASLLVGYLVYDYTHLAIHRGNLRTRLGRHLRRHHLLHHFVTPNARWGVTSPLWDWVFGTGGRRPLSRNHIAVIG
ncbi:MAG TPA: sterol desaturase family protein [Candidatus Methylomirabilis sp.]|nr:sterol desaturase family protein [Candidatus Methylomirabilis sp.]